MNSRNEGAVRARGVLHPWQRRLYTILLVPLGLMAANSIYLVAFTKYSSFFMAMLLMHLVLGLLIAIPFLVFAFTHGARMLANIRNRNAKIAGITIVGLSLLCIGTGVTMALKGATLTNRPIYLAHVFAIPSRSSRSSSTGAPRSTSSTSRCSGSGVAPWPPSSS